MSGAEIRQLQQELKRLASVVAVAAQPVAPVAQVAPVAPVAPAISKEMFDELYQHQLSLQNTVHTVKAELAVLVTESLNLKTQLSELFAQQDASKQ